jgi:hypothetical protein
VEKQLRRIDEEIQPKKKPHVEPRGRNRAIESLQYIPIGVRLQLCLRCIVAHIDPGSTGMHHIQRCCGSVNCRVGSFL